MIMLDTVDFPIVFLGAIRAGIVPVPLNTLLTTDQYAYVLADSRARVLFISEALLSGGQGHSSAACRTSSTCGGRRQGRGRPSEVRRRDLARESDTNSRPLRPIATSRPSGSIRPARPACPRACGTCIRIRRRRPRPMRTRCSASARSDVCLSAAKLFFAYGLGNALTFPMSVGAPSGALRRPADAGCDVRV